MAEAAGKLELCWSPERIAGWLRRRFPTGTVMHVSHETIYRSLFVQARGDLRHELTRHLRTGRAMRRPAGARLPDGRGLRPNTLNIPERPAEAVRRVTGSSTDRAAGAGLRLGFRANLAQFTPRRSRRRSPRDRRIRPSA